MKLAILEQKLLKEEHERKLVQAKADEVSAHAHFSVFEITDCFFNTSNTVVISLYFLFIAFISIK